MTADRPSEHVVLSAAKDLAFSPAVVNSLLTRELWTSFASLLRSQVAMHSIAAPAHSLRIHSGSGSQLDVLGPVGKLTVVGPNAAGVCASEFRPENCEMADEYAIFLFTADGLVRIEAVDESLELEAAVEYLLRKVQA